MKMSYTLGPYPQLPKKRSDPNIQAQGCRKMRNQILDSGARVLGGPEPSRDGWAQTGTHRWKEHSPDPERRNQRGEGDSLELQWPWGQARSGTKPRAPTLCPSRDAQLPPGTTPTQSGLAQGMDFRAGRNPAEPCALTSL